jgi:hypothetical protein
LDASINGEMLVHEEISDMKTDPGEALNLASDPKYAGKLEELRESWTSRSMFAIREAWNSE